jgi:hypothetical protein
MLGGPRSEGGPVTQAAFIRSLTASFIKSWSAPRTPIGGLFGGSPDESDGGLPWTRVQQSAFVVYAWRAFGRAVVRAKHRWATQLRDLDELFAQLELEEANDDASAVIRRDPAFSGPYTLIATDQGVRPFLQICNDLCYVRDDVLRLRAWTSAAGVEDVTPNSVEREMNAFSEHPAARFLDRVGRALASYDWRSAKTPHLAPAERTLKLGMRGSGGYTELRRRLLEHIVDSGESMVSNAASDVRTLLNYD